jgi:hypothetical protein
MSPMGKKFEELTTSDILKLIITFSQLGDFRKQQQ